MLRFLTGQCYHYSQRDLQAYVFYPSSPCPVQARAKSRTSAHEQLQFRALLTLLPPSITMGAFASIYRTGLYRLVETKKQVPPGTSDGQQYSIQACRT